MHLDAEEEEEEGGTNVDGDGVVASEISIDSNSMKATWI